MSADRDPKDTAPAAADPTPSGGKTPISPREEAHAVMIFQEFLRELRYSRMKEDIGVIAFGGFLLLLTAWCLLHDGAGPTLWRKGILAVGLIALFLRLNEFLTQNRARQNQIKKVINTTERTYSFPEDRAYIRLTDLKNLDGPGEWDKSEYSLADWDRSEYSFFLKFLGVAALAAALIA